MFKMDPQFIVAGEIIRTARMYASSVSPLSRANLERIGGGLFERLGLESAKHGRKLQAEIVHDWTNNIKIGGEVFEIITEKGKKTVKLPWERLQRVMGSSTGEALFKGLRGVIILKNDFTLLKGEKLNLILTLAPTLNISKVVSLTQKVPGKKNFNSETSLDALVAALPLLLTPVCAKNLLKEMGFICLTSNGEGIYRLRCSRGFHTALNESLSSLETLIDELKDDVDLDKKHLVNTAYRRLSDYLS